MDKKTATILALLVLLAIAGVGWLKAALGPKIPSDTYEWTEYFRGYDAYLDRRIYRGVMQTTSMKPTINVGDSVLWVEIDNKAELKVDDIIIYNKPGVGNIVHRIVEVGVGYRENQFKTRGDNPPSEEYWVPGEDIQGLVIGVIYHS